MLEPDPPEDEQQQRPEGTQRDRRRPVALPRRSRCEPDETRGGGAVVRLRSSTVTTSAAALGLVGPGAAVTAATTLLYRVSNSSFATSFVEMTPRLRNASDSSCCALITVSSIGWYALGERLADANAAAGDSLNLAALLAAASSGCALHYCCARVTRATKSDSAALSACPPARRRLPPDT